MRYVLDTNVVIAALGGTDVIASRLEGLSTADVGIPLVVVAELLHGARRSRRTQENLDRVTRLRSTFPILPITDTTVERYGAIRASREARGVAKTDFDLLIACAALELRAVLVTHDGALKDGHIEGLVVEDWLEDGTEDGR